MAPSCSDPPDDSAGTTPMLLTSDAAPSSYLEGLAPAEPSDVSPRPTEGSARSLSDHDVTLWVQQHHAALYRYAYRLTGCHSEAEDLVQQTFLVAHREGGTIRDPGSVSSWLYAVLRNAYCKSRRKAERNPVASRHANVELDELPAAAERARWDGRDLQEALNALPDEFKVVLLLFYFEDASYKEIAERLQVPLGTVMSRLSRAKRLLRGLLLSSDSPSAASPSAASPSAASSSSASSSSGNVTAATFKPNVR